MFTPEEHMQSPILLEKEMYKQNVYSMQITSS